VHRSRLSPSVSVRPITVLRLERGRRLAVVRVGAEHGERRQVTDSLVGVIDGGADTRREGIVWFEDETGDESGRWVVQPFSGGETRAFLEGCPTLDEGLSQARDRAAGVSDLDGFAIHVPRRRPCCRGLSICGSVRIVAPTSMASAVADSRRRLAALPGARRAW